MNIIRDQTTEQTIFRKTLEMGVTGQLDGIKIEPFVQVHLHMSLINCPILY